ncbi:MAG: hypothetical protein AAF960_01950 [Bacteroidota bacterium]
MKTYSSLVISLFFIINTVFSQAATSRKGWYVEPFVGHHQLAVSFSERSYFAFGQRESKSGFLAGGKVGWQFPAGVNLQAGIFLAPKGLTVTNLNIPPLSEEEVFSDVTLDYQTLHFPLLLGYQFDLSERFSLRPSLGLIFGTSFNHTYEEVVTNRPMSFMTIGPARVVFEKFDLGYTGELSFLYKIKPNISLTLNGSFLRNEILVQVFPDFSKGRRITMFNEGFYFTIGPQVRF